MLLVMLSVQCELQTSFAQALTPLTVGAGHVAACKVQITPLRVNNMLLSYAFCLSVFHGKIHGSTIHSAARTTPATLRSITT